MKVTNVTMAVALALSSLGMNAQDHEFIINSKKLGAPIPYTMYGIFFEDINYAADGGLYAELVKNRSFEFPDHYAGWDISGKVSLRNDGPFNKNPHYVRLAPSGHSDKHTMIENHGFFGMGVKGGEEYRFSVWARVPDGGSAKLWVDLVDNATMSDDQKIGNVGVDVSGKEWKKYTAIIKPSRTFAKAHLRVWGDSKVTTLEELHPGVFRFPGGCIVEGTDLETRYQWKNSVGPVENRPLNENRWHYTFTSRYFPDYFQSYGLGFFEYFQLSEEIGSEPLPVVSVGLACQFQNHSEDAHVPVDELQPYIDDVIDLIEFANGDPAKNQWAKLRADMGHPAPFNLKYVAIGNEQWGQTYIDHLQPFVDQVRKLYPNIKIIGTSGPNSEGEDFDFLWPEMRKIGADLVDEHFYRPESWFLASGNRYDNYPRKGSKVFAGEYACHGRGKKWNHFEAALLEAAFLTGVERNADVVEMATYAPLFAHVEGWQWRPDMIWYDNLTSFRSCSYQVQQMYSTTKGTNVVSLLMNGKPVAGNSDQDGLFASANFDSKAGCYNVKIVNTGNKAQSVTLNLKGMKGEHTGKLITFHADDMDGENTLSNPNKYEPKTQNITVSAPTYSLSIPAKTFAIYQFAK